MKSSDVAARPTVAFDVIGTLFSLNRPRDALMHLGAPPYALDLWFAQSLRDFFALSHSGAYVPLKDALTAALPRTLTALDVAFGDDELQAVVATFRELDPSDGAHEACSALVSAGWKLMTLTNGSEDTTRSLLRRAGFEEWFEAVLSCDAIGVSKPHPDVYALAKRQAEGELWLVAAHAWDVAGAKRAGLKTAWIPSAERHYLSIYPAPDVEARDLAAVTEQMLKRGES